MIWCRFQNGNKPSYGVIEDEQVFEVEGSPFDEYKVTKTRQALSAVKLLVPVVPPTMYATGSNYKDHIEGMAVRHNRQPNYPKTPFFFYFSSSALVPTNADIVKPTNSGPNLQYEGELVAVFGKKSRHVSRDEALDSLFGWTIGNDISQRDWQYADRFLTRGKCCDTFKPLGPWINTKADIDKMTTTIRHNDKDVLTFKTGAMIFDVVDYIVEVSKYMTIYPGDVFWLGTDGIPENLAPGDTIEVINSEIGVLKNQVVDEKVGAVS